MTVCHATGDPSAPYEQIEASGGVFSAHLEHPDDILPAPPGGCPATALGLQETPATPTPTVAPDVVPPPQRRPARRGANRRRAPARRPAPAQAPTADAPAGGGAPGPALRTVSLTARTLPLTGGGPPYIALVGLGLLLAGTGVRLRYVGP